MTAGRWQSGEGGRARGHVERLEDVSSMVQGKGSKGGGIGWEEEEEEKWQFRINHFV